MAKNPYLKLAVCGKATVGESSQHLLGRKTAVGEVSSGQQLMAPRES